jgi:uncharacterized protein (TIGR02996 family)
MRRRHRKTDAAAVWRGLFENTMTPLTERDWLTAVVDNLADDTTKLIYADWLEERGDVRSAFLRQYVAAAKTMNAGDFPQPHGLPEEWLELIGFRLLEPAASAGCPQLKERLLRLARPALRMKEIEADDTQIAIGASKIGGLPDMPAGFRWPPGGDCHAIYNDDTGGTDRLAGFMAQVNFADICETQAGRLLPFTGVLSLFCFQDWENDHPDAIGAKAIYFSEAGNLKRTKPPKELTAGNEVMAARRLSFEQTLDLPDSCDGPWSQDLAVKYDTDEYEVLDQLRESNFCNMLGYARATTGSDPTPNKHSRHLIVLKNAYGCQLHIQIDQQDLAARNFDAITLRWVDFD